MKYETEPKKKDGKLTLALITLLAQPPNEIFAV